MPGRHSLYLAAVSNILATQPRTTAGPSRLYQYTPPPAVELPARGATGWRQITWNLGGGERGSLACRGGDRDTWSAAAVITRRNSASDSRLAHPPPENPPEFSAAPAGGSGSMTRFHGPSDRAPTPRACARDRAPGAESYPNGFEPWPN